MNMQSSIASSGRPTDMDWSELREKTIAAHETPALFESIAEISDESDDHEDFETEGGVSISAYSSPINLWAMKTGQYNKVSDGKRGLWSRIKWGVIQQAFDDQDVELRRPEKVLLHPSLDFMSSNVDMELSEDNGQTWLPVISFNVASSVLDTWRNAVGEWIAPEYVQIQAQHHLAVRGGSACHVVGLFGGITPRVFKIERDEFLVGEIVETIMAFWTCVTENRRPSQATEKDLAVMNYLCSQINPETTIIDARTDDELLKLLNRKEGLGAKKRKIEEELEEIKLRLAERMEGVGAAIISETQQLAWIRTGESVVSYTKPAGAYLRTRKNSAKNAGSILTELVKSSSA